MNSPTPPRRPPYRPGPWPHPEPAPAPPRPRRGRRIAAIASGAAGVLTGVVLMLVACGRDALAVIPLLLAIFGGLLTHRGRKADDQ